MGTKLAERTGRRSSSGARMTRIGAAVNARMSSQRLPGKVLRPLHGAPLLWHLFDRLAGTTGVDELILATSLDPSDDPLEAFAEQHGIACHRGPLDDVLTRLTEVADRFHLDKIVRLSGDSPLLDPALVESAVHLARINPVDIVTNVFPRSFPKGQSVEVLSRPALDRLSRGPLEPSDREHVTTALYRNPDSFSILGISRHPARAGLQLSVDTESDFTRVAAIMARLTDLHAPLDQIIAAADTIDGRDGLCV